MAHTNKVVRSVNLDGEHICVDIFQRPDGSFGFDEYRRDPEDPAAGWYSIGYYGSRTFRTEIAATEGARCCVPWFADQTA